MTKRTERRPRRRRDPAVFPHGGAYWRMLAVRTEGGDQPGHDGHERVMLMEACKGADVLFLAAAAFELEIFTLLKQRRIQTAALQPGHDRVHLGPTVMRLLEQPSREFGAVR